MEKIRVCLICEKYQLQREYLPFHEALQKQFDLTRYFADEKWPEDITRIGDYEKYDAFIWFVRFRELMKKPSFRWQNYQGLRIMHDQDALYNFSLLAGPRYKFYLGAWPEVFRRNEFHILACTGKATRDQLLEQGVNAYWVPKAYDKKLFFDKGESRKGICYFGGLYTARGAMLHYVYKKGIEVERFRCSHFELNNYLNRYEICLICNMVGLVNPGISRLIDPFIPRFSTFSTVGFTRPVGRTSKFLRIMISRLLWLSYGVKLSPGPEVMLKNFEVAASGCVAFCDEIPELKDLGFEDGKTMVSYRDFDELIGKIEYYSRSPELLSQIAKNATHLCAENHTWDHRAKSFEDLIHEYSKNRTS